MVLKAAQLGLFQACLHTVLCSSVVCCLPPGSALRSALEAWGKQGEVSLKPVYEDPLEFDAPFDVPAFEEGFASLLDQFVYSSVVEGAQGRLQGCLDGGYTVTDGFGRSSGGDAPEVAHFAEIFRPGRAFSQSLKTGCSMICLTACSNWRSALSRAMVSDGESVLAAAKPAGVMW